MENFINSSNADILIVGAGPAGLLAALGAAGLSAVTLKEPGFSFRKNRLKIVILEKMPSPGKKLLIAGTGRCNVTHAGNILEFFIHYGRNASRARFIKPPLLNFTNEDWIYFLESRGLPCIELNDGKIFPQTQRSRDVLNVLLQACEEAHIQILCGRPVCKAEKKESGFFEVKTESGEIFQSKTLILSVGGKSYPGTGSTGDGEWLAKSFQHTLVPMRPALTPALIKNYKFKSCAGISLPEAELTLWRVGKMIAKHRGDLLFTHRGLSGPGILDLSREICVGDEIQLTSVPGLTDIKLSELIRLNPQREIINMIRQEYSLPERYLERLLDGLCFSHAEKCYRITRLQRRELYKLLTDFRFQVSSLGNYNEAMVTAGGVELQEVNRQTMESRKVPGLFFAGEVLDVDGDTGGYNIQFAVSSGVLSGEKSRNFTKIASPPIDEL